jgi:hypothetical protein
MTKLRLANEILSLTWGDLMEVAGSLAESCQDKDARPRMTDDIDFARLLHDWAEAQGEE